MDTNAIKEMMEFFQSQGLAKRKALELAIFTHTGRAVEIKPEDFGEPSQLDRKP